MFIGGLGVRKLSGAFIQGSDESSTVLTVWDGERLVGLTRVLDDTEMLAQIHYVLVDLEYQGQGIAGRMIVYIKDKYKDFLYIEGMPEDREIAVLSETWFYGDGTWVGDSDLQL